MTNHPKSLIKTLIFSAVLLLLLTVLLAASGPPGAIADKNSSGREAARATLVNQVLAGQLRGRQVYMCEEPILADVSIRAWTGLREETLISPYAEGWFFFIDDLAGANWCHPCRYVFVDLAGDRYVVVAGQSPPTLERESADAQGKTRRQELPLQEIPASIRQRAVEQIAPQPQPNVPEPPTPEPMLESLKSTGTRRALLISGGYNNGMNYPRYRNDLSHFYVTFKKYGFTDADIIVACASGAASDLDNDGDNDVDSSARKATILVDIAALPANLDHLVVFVTDHGTTGPLPDGAQSGDSFIICWDDGDGIAEYLLDDGLSDVDLTTAILARNPTCVSYVLEQCFSGGFLDNLRNSADEVVMSAACRGDEVSYGCDTEGQFDEFCYHYTNGLRRAQPQNDTAAGICTDGTAVKPDNDYNNTTTQAEDFAYAENRDSWPEQPQFNNVPAGHGARSWLGSCPTNYCMLDKSGDRSRFNVASATSVALVFDSQPNVCMNVDLEREATAGNWVQQDHWNFNCGKTRTFAPQAGTGQYRLVSCCGTKFNVVAHFDGSGNSTPSSGWNFPGYTLGPLDGDASDFGIYYAPRTVIIRDDLPLSEVPRYVGTGYAPGLTFLAPYDSAAGGEPVRIRLTFAAVGVYPSAPDGQIMARVLVDSLPLPGSPEFSIGVADTARRFCCDLGQFEPRPGEPYAITFQVDDGYIELDGIVVADTGEEGAGPSIVAEEPFLAQDAFPAVGVIDAMNPCQNWVRFDMAAVVDGAPGDSIVFTIACTRDGTRLAAPPALHYILAANPVFDSCRTEIPAGSWSGGSNTAARGAVLGHQVTDAVGAPVPDRYCFDLPDTGFFFPGDIIHYYIEATDTDLFTTLAPPDTGGFDLFPDNPSYGYQRYSALYTVRALPSILTLAAGAYTQPEILWWRDCTEEDALVKWMHAWWEVGASENRAAPLPYDTYYTQAASSGVGNGLGGRATTPQLSGYRLIVYSSGDESAYTITLPDSQNVADDVGVLDGWLELGSKNFFAGGSGLACDLAAEPSHPAKLAFLDEWLQVHLVGCSHLPYTTSPQASVGAVPFAGNPFHQLGLRWAASNAHAPRLGEFDWVTATGWPGKTAHWLGPSCADINTSIAAAVYNYIPTYDDQVFYLPYDLAYIFEDQHCGGNPGTGTTRAVRSNILADVLGRCGFITTVPTTVVPRVSTLVTQSYPNPFNPAVTIKYAMPKRGRLTVRIYNVRGELIRTLLDREVEAGVGIVTWDGTNQRGAGVASGVYFYQAKALDTRIVEKIALVK